MAFQSKSKEAQLLPLLIIAVWATMSAGDLYIPSLPIMTEYYQASDDWLNLTITVNLLCFPVVGIFYGPLSDAYGRRKIFIIGMGIFLLGSLICALIPNLFFMIVGRFIQGAGTCVADILALAMIRDVYSGNKSAKAITVLELYIATCPAVAPIIGGFIAKYAGWQYNFHLIFIMSFLSFSLLLWRLPETLPEERRVLFSFKAIYEAYRGILKDRTFLGCSLISGFVFSGLYVLIVGTPYLYQDVFGFDVLMFTIYLLAGVIAYIFAAEINRRTVESLGSGYLMWRGIVFFFSMGVVNVLVAYIWPMDPDIIRAATAAYVFFMGFAISNSTAIALDIFPDKAGSASAALIAIEMLLSSIFITLVGYFYTDSFESIAWLLFVASTAALLSCYIIKDKKWKEKAL